MYPDVQSLAAASPDDVNKLWAGLGYYRRAQQLLLGAKKVASEFHDVPSNKQALLSIPGIGPYTAGAILSIAFNQPEAVVDGNVIRVLSRLYAINLMNDGIKEDGINVKIDHESDVEGELPEGKRRKNNGGAAKSFSSRSSLEKICWMIAAELVDPDEPGDFNQALMELGATVCKPTSPSCAACPVREWCRARSIAAFAKEMKEKEEEKKTKREETTIDLSGSKEVKRRRQATLDGFLKKPTPTLSPHPTLPLLPPPSAPVSREILMALDLLPSDVTYFPVKQRKKSAREVSLSVWVITQPFKGMKEEERRYLLLRRPATGLLANQWEFPNVVTNTSSSESLTTIVDHVMSVANIDWMDESRGKVAGKGNVVGTMRSLRRIECMEPQITHIFSHEKHLMSINIVEVDFQPIDSSASILSSSRWMTAAEMKEVGITTGCKKILLAVQKSLSCKGSTS